MLYKVGDYVKCLFQPIYWDIDDNDTNPENYYEEELLEFHPGFNDDMYMMLSETDTYEIVELNSNYPWVRLKSHEGAYWWWHIDWISMPCNAPKKLSNADELSPHRNVIIKIMKMQAARERKGYAI